jgi:hypothetical protein
MSRSPVLTDSLIRQALTPAAYVDAPSGLLAAVAAEVRRTPQSRLLLRWPWRSDLSAPFRPVPSRQLLWALAALGLLVALTAGALIGAGYLRQAPAIQPPAIPLSLTGIDTLPPDTTGYGDVLVDGAGTLWATGPGHVTRFDPNTGQRRTWTVSDDLSFSASVVAPASAGGLWLWSGQTIRRFDGTAMREQIPAPVGGTDPAALVEGPTGSLWASYGSAGPWRWDGSAWLATPEGGPPYGAWPLLVIADDDVWVVNLSYPGPTFLGLAHLAADHWVTFDGDDAAALSGQFAVLEAGQDRTVWVGSDLGIARYAGGSWTSVKGPGFGVVDLAIDGDGVAWALSGETPARVARLEGGTWTTYGPESGFPDRDLLGISATDSGVYLGTAGGLYRFTDERWMLAWPDTGAGPSTAGMVEILAVSEGEAWVADGQGLWHFVGGAWVGPEAPELSIHALALGSDGTLFVAGSGGVTVRRDGRWSMAWTGNPVTGNATSVAIAPSGSVWIAASGELVELREMDGEWSSRSISCPAGGGGVVVTADGAVWTGGIGYSGTSGLARIDGDSCVEVWPLGDARRYDIGGLAAGPAGGLAAVVGEADQSGGTSVVWFDGTAWSTLLTREAPGGGALAVGPMGEVWFSGRWPKYAIERYDNGAWHEVVAGVWASPISAAPDGTVWFGGPSGIQRIRVAATR